MGQITQYSLLGGGILQVHRIGEKEIQLLVSAVRLIIPVLFPSMEIQSEIKTVLFKLHQESSIQTLIATLLVLQIYAQVPQPHTLYRAEHFPMLGQSLVGSGELERGGDQLAGSGEFK